MILAIDVQYQGNQAFIAGVLFNDWGAEAPMTEYLSILTDVEEYEPGYFYKRELPCILQLLDEYQLSPSTIIIDGYVYLDHTFRPGLGKKLFDALDNRVEIIGVAKKAFAGIDSACEIYRGNSEKPLYITSTGELTIAKHKILSMFGNYRIPTLLKRVDQLCREAARNQ